MKITALSNLLWLLSTLGYAALLGALQRTRSFRRWPGLAAIAIDEFVAYVLLNALRGNYRAYFYVYFSNAIVVALLRLLLARDVLRALPGYDQASVKLRGSLWLIAALAAIVGSIVTQPPAYSNHLALTALYLQRSVNFTWGIVVFTCLGSLLVVGVGFTTTGFRIAIGALVRLLASLTLSLAMPAALRSGIRTHINEFDMALSFCVSMFWTASIKSAPRQDAEDLSNLSS